MPDFKAILKLPLPHHQGLGQLSTHNEPMRVELVVANTLWHRFWGLMGQAELPEAHGLWITPCNSIHSAFMRFKFDALFLDKEHRVVFMMAAMAPWRVSPVVWKAHSVIELPAGTLAQSTLKVGATVSIEPV